MRGTCGGTQDAKGRQSIIRGLFAHQAEVRKNRMHANPSPNHSFQGVFFSEELWLIGRHSLVLGLANVQATGIPIPALVFSIPLLEIFSLRSGLALRSIRNDPWVSILPSGKYSET